MLLSHRSRSASAAEPTGSPIVRRAFFSGFGAQFSLTACQRCQASRLGGQECPAGPFSPGFDPLGLSSGESHASSGGLVKPWKSPLNLQEVELQLKAELGLAPDLTPGRTELLPLQRAFSVLPRPKLF